MKKFAILSIPILLYSIPLQTISNNCTLCLFKNITGTECYGCGISRACLHAMHFNFAAAFTCNKLFVIILPLLIYVWLKTLLNTN